MRHFIKHFNTITYHKLLVLENCFKVGLYWQGITHDLSKYSPCEFLVGAKYYQGNQSPNNAERMACGYSDAWLHHKGRNRHHYEFWIDYSTQSKDGTMVPIEMPKKYLVEMMMDRIAASKVYNGKNYNDGFPLQYFKNGKEHAMMHSNTKRDLEELLTMLRDKGEKETFRYIKVHILNKS